MGTLFVVATPIGNLDDVSSRAVQILRDVPLIAAEDTRHSKRLLSRFDISTPLVSYHRHNQAERQSRLLKALAKGDVALISDSGTPAISDPGTDLVRAAVAAGHRVSPIPGPTSVAAAVSVSGLIDGPFVALGFLPRERGPRIVVIARAAASGWPLVIFEAANRLSGTLTDLLASMGNRQAAVMRELTKIHEEVRIEDLERLRDWALAKNARGEIVLVVAGAERPAVGESEARSVLDTLLKSGLTASQAAREAAVMTGVGRSELYRMALDHSGRSSIGLKGELALPDQDALQQPFGNEEGPEG